MRKPNANFAPTANKLASPNERVIEVSSDHGNAWISLVSTGKQLHILIYRMDRSVVVRVGKYPDHMKRTNP